MNNTNMSVQSVSLQTAVLMQVQEFANTNQSFSRWDITNALRQKCNDGLLEIPEVENPNSSVRFNIQKSAVDAIFEQLWNSGISSGFPPLTVTFDRSRGYRLFSVDVSAIQPTVATVATTPAVTSTVSTPTVSNQPSGNLSDPEIRRRITLYMNGVLSRGSTATLKQIQSAIKRGNRSTGLTTKELFNIVTSLGYKV